MSTSPVKPKRSHFSGQMMPFSWPEYANLGLYQPSLMLRLVSENILICTCLHLRMVLWAYPQVDFPHSIHGFIILYISKWFEIAGHFLMLRKTYTNPPKIPLGTIWSVTLSHSHNLTEIGVSNPFCEITTLLVIPLIRSQYIHPHEIFDSELGLFSYISGGRGKTLYSCLSLEFTSK